MAAISASRSGFIGLEYQAANLTWEIPKGLYVWGTNVGVQSIFAGSTLINRGDVIGGSAAAGTNVGVLMMANSLVRNEAGGSIFGYTAGVEFSSSAASVRLVNHGRINSPDTGVLFDQPTNGVSLTNTGTIFGHLAAVHTVSKGSGGTFVNSGVIRTDGGIGIWMDTIAGLVTQITNQAGGLIAGGGGESILAKGAGAVRLTNNGTLRGDVVFQTNEIDSIVNRGKIVGEIRLGNANDTFNGTTGTSGHVLGQAGDDRLSGSNHADWLDGGVGRDVLAGKLGADRFDYNSAADSPNDATHDVINGFSHGQHDRIDLGDLSGTPFSFRGTLLFDGGPDVRYQKLNPTGTANDKTLIFVDITGDKVADMQIELKGLHNLVAGDFFL